MKAVIVANGKKPSQKLLRQQIKNAGLLLAVDGGITPFRQNHILPHFLIGDLDSLHEEDMQFANDRRIEVIRLPREKDDTDTQAALDFALDKGADEIILLGAIGSRFDHSYANVLLLVRAWERKAKAFIIDDKNILFVAQGSVLLKGKPGDFISILPLKEGTVATASFGLKYPLNDLSLPMNRPVGVSNEMTGHSAGVTVKSGLALFVRSKD